MPKRGEKAVARVRFLWPESGIKGAIPCFSQDEVQRRVAELERNSELRDMPIEITVEQIGAA